VSAADECRQHAATCLRAAQLAVLAQVKATFIDMAQHWNQLAEHMDQLAVTETLRCRLEPGKTEARNRVH
jgi:hypothetical protein